MITVLAAAIVVDVTVALAAGLLICWMLRRRPAALRHWVLAAALGVAAAAPLLEVTLPSWELPVLTSTEPVTSETSAFSSEPAISAAPALASVQDAPRIAWLPMLVTIWAAGCGLLLSSLLAGLARLTWMTRRCRPVGARLWRERVVALSAQCCLRRPVTILESPDRPLLITSGLLRPRIIVPASAASWSEERIDVVLAHELAHIGRCDWAVQIAAETLRALHWFNPFIWIACRRLRVESELACDDAVLRRGVDAADYASHLLAVARHVVTAGKGWVSAPAIAHVSTLERRIAAMLNVSSNRAPVTRAARLVVLLLPVTITVSVAAATLTERVDAAPFVSGSADDIPLAAAPMASRAPAVVNRPVPRPAPTRTAAFAPLEAPVAPPQPPAQQKPATLTGSVRDSSGAVMPGVLVALNDASGTGVSTTTDSGGQFRFRNIVPGEYQFTASLPGFTTRTTALSLAEGQELNNNVTLAVGQLAETITVTCAPATAALRSEIVPALSLKRSTIPRLFAPLRETAISAPAFAAQGVPIRVGGQIRAPRQVKRVAPVCPAVTPGAGLVVLLEATIGADGLIKDVKVLRPAPADDKQAGYVQAAVTAVRQWEYTPTLLNNVPTAVIMTVAVTFVVPAQPN